MDASSVAGADCLLADRWQYIPASVALPDRLSSSKESRLRNKREKRVNNDKKVSYQDAFAIYSNAVAFI